MVKAAAAAKFFNELFEKYGTRAFVVTFNNGRYGYAACQKVGKSSIFVAYVTGKGTEAEPFLPNGSRQEISVHKYLSITTIIGWKSRV